jgi:hypothetical protein
MGAIRLESMTALRTALLAVVPTLEIRVGQQLPNKNLCLPSLVIRPTSFRYHPNQEEDYVPPDPDETVVISQVGTHEGLVQLLLYTATSGDRYTIEQKLIDAFLTPEGRPGVLLTTVSGDPDLGTFLASWELDEEEWVDEKAFSNQLGSLLPVMATIPALIKRTGVPTIDELVLALTNDFETVFTPETLVPPAVELVEINDDGTISSPP